MVKRKRMSRRTTRKTRTMSDHSHPIFGQGKCPKCGATYPVLNGNPHQCRCDPMKVLKCACGKPGQLRIDNGLIAGVHCDECWDRMVAECRSRSW